MTYIQSEHRFRCDWIVGCLHVLYSLRIPIHGFEAHSKLLLPDIGVFLFLLLLTAPLILSFRFGALIQASFQVLVLFGPPMFNSPGVAAGRGSFFDCILHCEDDEHAGPANVTAWSQESITRKEPDQSQNTLQRRHWLTSKPPRVWGVV